MTVLASPVVEAIGPRPKVVKTWAERRRATIALAIIAPFAIAAIFSAPSIEPTSAAGMALKAIAYLLFVLGGACRFWATLYIGGRKGRGVVREGPYSMMRNPLYLASFLLALSAVVFVQDLGLLIGFTIAAVTYITVTIPSEERRLASKLGEEYQRYCREVPRFLPRSSLFAASTTLLVDWHCLATEGRRALRWIWIPVAGELIGVLRIQPWWPHF
jgi:protein-S-isoprenylcysteine O-methyltransferase Ste14